MTFDQPRVPEPAVAAPWTPRPGSVTAASALFILFGALVVLVGAGVTIGGLLFENVSETPGAAEQLRGLPPSVGGLLVVLGLLIGAYGILQILTGIFALLGRSWARMSGIILAVLGAIFSMGTVFPGEGGSAISMAISLGVLGAYAYVAWAMITNAPWFARPA